MQHRFIFLATAGAAMLALLCGCADINDTGMWALSTRVQAYAIINDQLVHGDMLLATDHTGRVSLRDDTVVDSSPSSSHISLDTPAPKPANVAVPTNCEGRLHYTGTTMGVVDLRCNNGTVFDVRVALIGETRGYGYGQSETGQASLTFGMTPAEARAHLTVPQGRQLVERKEGPTGLELR